MDIRQRAVGATAYSFAKIATALALVAGAAGLARLQFAVDMQRVDVRYVDEATDADRMSVEQQSGLVSGIEREPGTWSYVLQKRSRSEIQTLVSNRLVEDTHHIDRSSFRVVLDRPDLPATLRATADAGWLPWISGLLALCGAATLWSSWRDLLAGFRQAIAGSARIATALSAQPTALVSHLTLVGIAAATAIALPLGVEGRPDEAIFVHAYEATSILAGDHPYRDFFEWGAPLPALLSAGAQWLVGYRVIGELVLQWGFVVAGVVVAFHLGLRQAASIASVLAVLPVTLLVLITTGHHFSKLFCIPVGIWCAWRYLDRPTTYRAVTLGFFTSVAFLFRHDYGLWTGLSSILAIALVRVIRPELRSARSLATDCTACALAAAITLLPWAIVVGTAEGLPSYITARIERFEYSRAAGTANPYGALLRMNPVRQLRPVTLTPEPGVVSFEWAPHVDDQQQRDLESRYRLRPLKAPGVGPPSYDVPDVHDVRLLSLRDQIRNETGFDWPLLNQATRNLPSPEGSAMWLAQMTMLVPIALIVSGIAEAYLGWSRSESVRVSCMQRLLAGIVLVCINETLLREWAYFIVVAPVTAALSARFLARRPLITVGPSSQDAPLRRVLDTLGRALAAALTVSATYAATARSPLLFEESVSESARHVRDRMQEWLTQDADGHSSVYFYLRECTTSRDRLLVAGSTPYYVPYYTHRPMAGGHLDWSLGLRDDSGREAQSLELLKKQSVPFVVGRGGDVLDEFQGYPRIRAYLATQFATVEGSGGSLLYDKRRHVVRTFGPDHMPCFH